MQGGLHPDGEEIIAYRSPKGEGEVENELSFSDWKNGEKLPPFQDHVEGFNLTQPPEGISEASEEHGEDWPFHVAHHPAFGPKSVVKVPVPGEMIKHCDEDRLSVSTSHLEEKSLDKGNLRQTRSRRTKEKSGHKLSQQEQVENVSKEKIKTSRRRAKERWYYETIPAPMVKTTDDVEFPSHQSPDPGKMEGDITSLYSRQACQKTDDEGKGMDGSKISGRFMIQPDTFWPTAAATVCTIRET